MAEENEVKIEVTEEGFTLAPKMFVLDEVKKFWDLMTDEQKIRAEWFHPTELTPVPNKFHVFRNPGFWFNC
jgi:hypothetical protein